MLNKLLSGLMVVTLAAGKTAATTEPKADKEIMDKIQKKCEYFVDKYEEEVEKDGTVYLWTKQESCVYKGDYMYEITYEMRQVDKKTGKLCIYKLIYTYENTHFVSKKDTTDECKWY